GLAHPAHGEERERPPRALLARGSPADSPPARGRCGPEYARDQLTHPVVVCACPVELPATGAAADLADPLSHPGRQLTLDRRQLQVFQRSVAAQAPREGLRE